MACVQRYLIIEVSDTTGDATGTKAGNIKISDQIHIFLFTAIFIIKEDRRINGLYKRVQKLYQ